MTERCTICGANLALVGFVHRCVPRQPLRVEPKNTAHPDRATRKKSKITKKRAKAK